MLKNELNVETYLRISEMCNRERSLKSLVKGLYRV